MSTGYTADVADGKITNHPAAKDDWFEENDRPQRG